MPLVVFLLITVATALAGRRVRSVNVLDVA
jgi:hypothetical protein